MVFGGPCKHLVNFDGVNINLSGLSTVLPIGGGPLNFSIGQLGIKKETLQTATDIVMALDAIQYGDCIRIEQTPKDSPERYKIIQQAMENQRSMLQYLVIMKLVASNPTSEIIQKALADWISSQALRLPELSNKLDSIPDVLAEGENIMSSDKLKESIDHIKKADPIIFDSIENGVTLNEKELFDML
jgi:hypothetical protein